MVRTGSAPLVAECVLLCEVVQEEVDELVDALPLASELSHQGFESMVVALAEGGGVVVAVVDV